MIIEFKKKIISMDQKIIKKPTFVKRSVKRRFKKKNEEINYPALQITMQKFIETHMLKIPFCTIHKFSSTIFKGIVELN